MSDVPCAREDCTFRSTSPFAVLPHLVSLPFFTCDKCKGEFVKQDDGSWKASAKVVKFDPVVVGEGYRFDADELLEAAKGKGFDKLAILGQFPDGKIWASGTANAGETVILIEIAKHKIIHGETS